jgi:catechol 2,3-dioxygenase
MAATNKAKVVETLNEAGSPRLPGATRLGAVRYTVADLGRQIDFYGEVLGFKLHWREGSEAGLGAGQEDLLRLSEVHGARRVRGTTGLYHTAFLVPNRVDLAQLLNRIAVTRTPIQGMSDHYTHEAIYLPDAEGNGIELAWDRPREHWAPLLEQIKREGIEAMMKVNGPLDVDSLFGELERNPAEWSGLNSGTQVGHVHLHVADLRTTKRFYDTILGFDTVMEGEQMGATFFSAGGYHHHIGTNVWNGKGAPPPPEDATGLRYFTVVLPDVADLEAVVEKVRGLGVEVETREEGALMRDPVRNGVLLMGAMAAR